MKDFFSVFITYLLPPTKLVFKKTYVLEKSTEFALNLPSIFFNAIFNTIYIEGLNNIEQGRVLFALVLAGLKNKLELIGTHGIA